MRLYQNLDRNFTKKIPSQISAKPLLFVKNNFTNKQQKKKNKIKGRILLQTIVLKQQY